ncbi:MAG: hypothetical protein WC465_04955 [Patescibacteria group bacterium]
MLMIADRQSKYEQKIKNQVDKSTTYHAKYVSEHREELNEKRRIYLKKYREKNKALISLENKEIYQLKKKAKNEHRKI